MLPKEIQHPPQFQMVQDNAALAAVCAQAESQSAVALDTEFIRIRSFYPKLGLIQLYDGIQVSLIDPLSITDFSPFVSLLANGQVTKVLHACSEDLEVFWHSFKQRPVNMFDTQIAASFLGFANSTGFAALIEHYFDLSLDKGASRTDWLARPLSPTQLQYAAADVWYLLPLYQAMLAKLEATPWLEAVRQDCERLTARKLEKNADSAYFNIPNAWKLQGEALARLQLLAKWRQEEAVKRDLALNFVVRAENLWAVANAAPKHTSELLALGLHHSEVRVHGKKLLLLVEQAKRIAPEDYPPPIVRLVDDPRYKGALKYLQHELKSLCPPDLSPDVIAGRKGLEALLSWLWRKNRDPEQLPELLQDWRKPYGEKLVAGLDALTDGQTARQA